MDRSEYEIARLDDEQVDEVKQLERQLTAQSGHAVTLIAYEEQDGE